MKQLFNRASRKLNSLFKKGAGLMLVSGMLFSVVMPIVPKVSAASLTAPAARVSFTFDDGIAGSTTDGSQGDLLAAKTLQQYGITGTAYIITNCVGVTLITTPTPACATNANPNVNYISWNDIATLHNTYGWEIGAHTENHPLTAAIDNPTLTDAQLDTEMSGSKAALAAQGYSATDFASPFGDYDNRSLAVTAKYYNSHRAFQDNTPVNTYPYNNYLMTTKDIQGDGKTDTDCTTLGLANCVVSVNTAEQYIAAAKASNQWLVLVFHNIMASGASATASDYQYNAADLGTIAAYAKSQGVTVSNVADGLASGTNLMTNSGFNNGIADGWTTDDPTNIKADIQATALAGHGSYDGTANGPLDSISLTGKATDSHLTSPTIAVDPNQTYTLTNFVNVTSTSGAVNFVVNEFNSAGSLISTKSVPGITGTTTANAVQVEDVNFLYKPSSASVAKAQLQVVVQGAGTRAYVDNLQWLSPSGAVTPPTPTPTPGQGGGSTDNRILVRPDGRAYYISGGQAHPIGNPAIRDCIAVRAGAGQWAYTTDAVIDGMTAGAQAHCDYEQETGLNFVMEAGDPTVWLVHSDGTKQHVGSLCVVDAYTTVLKKYHVFVVPQGETAGHTQTADYWASPSSCVALAG